MSTEQRDLGDEIPTTTPTNDEAIGTPAASISTKATPEEVTTAVEASDGLVSIRFNSVRIEGSLMLEAQPARQLRDDLDAALDELGEGEEGSKQ